MFRFSSRMVITGLLSLVAPLAAAQQARPQRTQQASQPQQAQPQVRASEYATVLQAEARSQALCEQTSSRVFVQHDLGTACVAYYATTARPRLRAAVLFFDGDVAPEDVNKSSEYLAELRPGLQRLADASGARIIFIARPGVFGSSGNHGQRRSSSEMLTMNAAVDVVKARFGLTDIVVAGQSGGSTIAAALLTLGRSDITCAVLGSGSLSVVDLEAQHRVRERLPAIRRELMHLIFYDPTDRLDWIARTAGRRIFVLGDPTDGRTPFPQQRQFADRLRSFGHHAVSIEVMGLGENMHGVTHHALRAAALCARGDAEASIRRVVATRQPAQQPAVSQQAGRTRTSAVAR